MLPCCSEEGTNVDEYGSDAENQVVALPAWRVFLALRGPGGPEVPDLSSELSLLRP